MTTIDAPAAPPLAPRQADPQLLARLTGGLFLVTFIAGIPPVFTFYVPVLSEPAYILGAGADGGLAWGAVLELILLVANIGTALALYPVLRQQNEALSLGYVAARLMECAFIAVGILCLLAIGTLRLEGAAGTTPEALVAAGRALVAVHDWTFRLGPGFVVGIGNGLILAYLLFRSRLVPRALSSLGLVGGPLIILSGLAVVLGLIEAGGLWQGIATVPEFFWELGLGLWLLIRGFEPKALQQLLAS